MKPEIVNSTPELNNILNKAENSLLLGHSIIYRDYLSIIEKSEVKAVDINAVRDYESDTRLFKISRIIYENKKNVLESLSAIYNTLGAAGYSLFFYFDGNGEKVDLYVGVSSKSKAGYGHTSGELLQQLFDGYLAGSQLNAITPREIASYLNLDSRYLDNQRVKDSYAITAVSGISSIATETQDDFMQGIEKFLDATAGRKFSGLIIAESVDQLFLQNVKAGYENAATQLSPLAKRQISYGQQQSLAVGTSICNSIGTSFSQTLGTTVTSTKTESYGESNSESESQSVTKDKSALVVAGIGLAIAGVAIAAAPATGGTSLVAGASLAGAAATEGASLVAGASLAGAAASGVAKGLLGSETKGTNFGITTNTNSSDSESKGKSKTKTKGTTYTKSKTSSYTRTDGTSNQITIDVNNKMIDDMLKKIDSHLERIDQARAFGGWNVASYFIADTETESHEIGTIFLSLTRGNDSSLENYALNTWNNENFRNRDLVLRCLNALSHPLIKLPDYNGVIAPVVTPATLVSGKEVAIQLSLPRKSTASISVVEAAPYARQVQYLNSSNQHLLSDNYINVGNIRHLWKDTKNEILLDINQLASHTLITGTTGVGKTTTVMSILAQVYNKNIPFMVIEPTKGEYKDLLGLSTSEHKVNYFITGKICENTLRINPFVFPHGIQLSDHVDRVCSVFNAAFPMYAAMPQVLEEAVFAAYEELGWDTITSRCVKKVIEYPTLRRVVDLIPTVVKSLGYSEQLSSDYIGALSTRLRSLCRGSLGMSLLCSDDEETSNEDLFKQSAVIDLSAMGSIEKRALIMGVMFMRLYEHRIAEGLPQNETTSLNHLMVLEEAHVLLKKSSTDQSQDSSNPRGMAIESFANALAEMRAYRQGFIIADQSASVLDDSVLKNTNTKIVMRAPFAQDRETLGGALSLNEEQTNQLAKLENHTAVIFQSNWLEAVLCSVKKIEIPAYLQNNIPQQTNNHAVSLVLSAVIQKRCNDNKLTNMDQIIEAAKKLNFNQHGLDKLQNIISNNKDRMTLDDVKFITQLALPELSDSTFKLLALSLESQLNHLIALIQSKTVELEYEITRQIGIEILRSISTLKPQVLYMQVQNMEKIK